MNHETIIAKLEELLIRQAECHNQYAHESSNRMERLNAMMEHYIEIQKTHIDAYAKNIESAVASRDAAQRNADAALDALRREQEKTHMLVELLAKNLSSNTACVNVGSIEKTR